MKVDRTEKQVKLTAESADESKHLVEGASEVIFTEFKVEVGQTVVIEATEWDGRQYIYVNSKKN